MTAPRGGRVHSTRASGTVPRCRVEQAPPRPAPADVSPPAGRYADQTLPVRRSRADYRAPAVVVLAVGTEIAAFYALLAPVFRGSASLAVMGTTGFAAAAVGLAHLAGQGLARRRCGDPRESLAQTWAAFAAWFLLGAAAFVTRLHIPQGSSASSPGRLEPSPVLPALLFGALFLAGGVTAIVATFVAFNPVAGALRRAEKRLQDATEAERSSRADLERAREALRQQELERRREEQRWRAARQQAMAEMRELQNYARSVAASQRGRSSVRRGR